jgi:endonuclease YncB( thermonuclease family)
MARCSVFLGSVATACLVLVAPIHAQTSFVGRCVGVIDGDSIKVQDGGTTKEIRLEGIDAPEKTQGFSDLAKQTLSGLVYGQEVVITGRKRDAHNRLLARVYVGATDVNLEMVRLGLAWHYKHFSDDQALANAELQAREQRVGLWVDRTAVPPWAYRHPSSSFSRPSNPSGATRAPNAAHGEVHGNTRSRVFHTSACPNYRCRNCTARFSGEAAALAAGYRPAGCCHQRQ